MDFKEAFSMLVKNYGIEILSDNFRVYSILSDYVGFSLYQINLIKLYYYICKQYDLASILKKKGLIKGREYLISIYSRFNKSCSYDEYMDTINPVSEIICKKDYLNHIENKTLHKKSQSIILRNSNKVNKKNPQQSLILKSLNKIKGIKIKTETKSVMFEYFDDNRKSHENIEIYYKIKNNKMVLNTYTIKSDTLYIDTKKAKSDVIIKIPKSMKLNFLNVTTKSTNIITSSYINIDKTSITTKTGNVDVKISGKDLDVKTEIGNINLNIDTINTNCNSKGGTINYCIASKKKKKRNIDISSTNGNILGHLGFMARIKTTGLFSKRGLVMSKIRINKSIVSSKLLTTNGKITII